MVCHVVVKSIDYDVELDFLENAPNTPAKSVNSDESSGVILERGPLAPSTYEVDFLISEKPASTPAGVVRSVKVPSVDRSTKPPLAVLNNSVSDTPVNSSRSASSVTHIRNNLTSDKSNDQPNNVSDTRSLNKPGPSTVDSSTKSTIPPAAPDRSTKPIPPTTTSADVDGHSAKIEKEQAELGILQAKKRQEASDLANLMREKRRLEMEMEKKRHLFEDQSITK